MAVATAYSKNQKSKSAKSAERDDNSKNEVSISKKRKLQKGEVKAKRRKHQDVKSFHDLNVLCNTLLTTRKNKDDKQKADTIGKIIAKLKDLSRKNIFSAQFSRSAQVCLKDGNQKDREEIWNILRGQIKEISLGKYSHKMALKLLLYGSHEIRDSIIKSIIPDSDVFFSKLGARIWEYAYARDIPASKQREMLYGVILPSIVILKVPSLNKSLPFDKLYLSLDDEMKKLMMDHLTKLLQRAIDKELLDKSQVHTLLKYITLFTDEEQLTHLMEAVSEGAVNLITTKDGIEALSRLLGYSTAKQRKSLIKSLKGKALEMANNQINYALLLRIFVTTDDTKFLISTIWKEIFKGLKEVCKNKFGSKVILQFLSPYDRRYFSEYEISLLKSPSPTSLKNEEQRNAELKSPLINAIQGLLLDDENDSICVDWLKDARAKNVLLEYLKETQDSKVVDKMMHEIKLEMKNPNSGEDSVIDHAIGHRSLLALLNQSVERPLSTSSNMAVGSCLLETIKPILPRVLQTRSVFVLLHILKKDLCAEATQEISQILSVDMLHTARKSITEKGQKCSGLDELVKIVHCQA